MFVSTVTNNEVTLEHWIDLFAIYYSFIIYNAINM